MRRGNVSATCVLLRAQIHHNFLLLQQITARPVTLQPLGKHLQTILTLTHVSTRSRTLLGVSGT